MTERDRNLFTKKFTFLLSGLCFFGLSHSLEVKPFGQFFLPADVTIAKDSKSVSSETEWETEYVIEAGLEALFPSEFLPMRSGFGLGFRTSQRVDDARATPASMPVWGVLSFGRIDRYAFFSPYFSMRGGYLMPLTGDDHWWERPVNFFVNWGVGTVLPKGFTPQGLRIPLWHLVRDEHRDIPQQDLQDEGITHGFLRRYTWSHPSRRTLKKMRPFRPHFFISFSYGFA